MMALMLRFAAETAWGKEALKLCIPNGKQTVSMAPASDGVGGCNPTGENVCEGGSSEWAECGSFFGEFFSVKKPYSYWDMFCQVVKGSLY